MPSLFYREKYVHWYTYVTTNDVTRNNIKFPVNGRDSTPGPVERMLQTSRVTVKLPRSVDKTKACVVCVKSLYKLL